MPSSDTTSTSRRRRRSAAEPGPVQLFRLFLAERRDPEPFYRALAARTVRELPFPISGVRILDLGSGRGHFTASLREHGADVVSVDLDADGLLHRVSGVPAPLIADARTLPFLDGMFGVVLCSNMLEHTPEPGAAISEMARILAPGGWLWLSWTTWYSPWGGHAISPFHYLGPRLGVRVSKRLFGEREVRNLPFEGLWPTHIGQVLRIVRATPELDLVDVRPRYYPSQRWIMKIPGLREVAAWNCLLLLRKRHDVGIVVESADPPPA